MRSYPSIVSRSLDAVFSWCQSVEKFRDEDRREIADLQRLAAPVRRLYSKTSVVGNVGSGEDDLMSYSIPDGIFSVDGYGLEIECAFTFAANANNKRIKVKLGTTTLYDSTAYAFNNKSMSVKVTILRKAASSQGSMVRVITNDSGFPAACAYLDATESLASATSFKCTGEATTTDDIVQKFMTVKWIPANQVESA